MIKRILIYMLIGAIITVGPLYYLNYMLLSGTSSHVVSEVSKEVTHVLKPEVSIPEGAQNISLTSDQGNLCYIKNGVLYIIDAKSGKTISTITDQNPVIYAVPLEDRNIVMYCTYDGNKLYIKTYDMDNSEERDQKSIRINDLNRVNSIKYSSLMSIVYIDVKAGTGSRLTDTIYRVDIMKSVSMYASNKAILDIALLSTKDSLVYQDSKDNVYIKRRLFKYNNYRKFKLLGTDINDCIYLIPDENTSDVLVVKDGLVQNEISLSDSSYIKSINKDGSVYLVYSDHLLDLSENRVIKINSGKDVIDITSGSVLCVDSNNKVSIEKAS